MEPVGFNPTVVRLKEGQAKHADPRQGPEFQSHCGAIKSCGGDQLVTDGRSPRLYSMTNHRVTASWKANDLEKDSVFRT